MKARLTILFVCAISAAAFAQFNKNNTGTRSNSAANLPLSDRLFFGGGGSFGSGTNPNGFKYNYFAINPLVGYRVTLPWSVGLQVTYQRYSFPTQGYTQNQYGISPFTQYRFGKLFIHGEYQMISVPNTDNTIRKMYSRLPLGLGFTQPIGQRVAINAIVLYDVLYNRATTVFASPFIVRVYFTAGGISF